MPVKQCWIVEGPTGPVVQEVSFKEALDRLAKGMFIHHADKTAALARAEAGETSFRFAYGFAVGTIRKMVSAEPRVILGLNGIRGSGKDTVASMLVKAGWVRCSFGDAIYREVAEDFGVTIEFLQNRETKELPQPELALEHCTDQVFVGVMVGLNPTVPLATLLSQPRSPREILQYWGTEYRRELCGDGYWRDQVAAWLRANPTVNAVITDVRYPEEADLVLEMGGMLARVKRPGLALGNDPGLLHISERAMLLYPIPCVLTNHEGPKGLENLEQAVRAMFQIDSPVTL